MFSLDVIYEPGNVWQDLITIPLEGLAIYSLYEYASPVGDPLWPFKNEAKAKERQESTHSKNWGWTVGGAASTLVLGVSWLYSEDFSLYRVLSCGVHTILWTEIATGTAKSSWRRHRPFWNDQSESHSLDDSYSFFSGHASHAFAIATYTSLVSYYYAPSWFSWIYIPGMMSLASWMAYARVEDHKHHLGDVIVGGFVGSLVSYWIFHQGFKDSSLSFYVDQNKIELSYVKNFK